jgi:hypothetical protein
MAGRLEQTPKSVARLRQLNPELRVSNLKDVLAPIGKPNTSNNTRKDCVEPGCPNDHALPDARPWRRDDRKRDLRCWHI